VLSQGCLDPPQRRPWKVGCLHPRSPATGPGRSDAPRVRPRRARLPTVRGSHGRDRDQSFTQQEGGTSEYVRKPYAHGAVHNREVRPPSAGGVLPSLRLRRPLAEPL